MDVKHEDVTVEVTLGEIAEDLMQLSESQLTLVGGGIAEVILG